MVLKGFIFSADAIIAAGLLLVSFGLFFAILENTHYSRLQDYEEYKHLGTFADTAKHHPSFGQAISLSAQGKENQARAILRNIVRETFGEKRPASIEIKVYDTNSQVSQVRASWPANKWPTAQDSVLSTTRTFAEGDYVGTITTTSW